MKKVLIASAIVAGSTFLGYGVSNAVQNSAEDVNNSNSTALKIEKDIDKSSILEVKEEVHYEVLKNRLDIEAYKGATITEFFWLGCPHCQYFEPHVQEWKDKLSKEMNVRFIKVAAPGTKRWNMDAKVYYTIREMGGSDEQVAEMLGLYRDENILHDKYPTKDRVEVFFEKIGLDPKKAMEIYSDEDLMMKYLSFSNSEFIKVGANSVPLFVVNGKYKVKFDTVRSEDDVFDIIKALAYKK